MGRLQALAAAFALVAAWALAGCQALWDLPSQMREPYGSSGSPPPTANQDEEESLP